MRKQNSLLMMVVCMSLIQASLYYVHAQRQEPPKPPPPPPPADFLIERDVVIAEPPTPAGAPRVMAPEIVMARNGEAFETMTFISSEMSFDSNPVKNAPYSAEAVTETTQTLGDGNRIARKTTASLYRDSAGRTRREQTLSAVGPFATAGDVPQTILINDPVAGVNYFLDPRTRTARKLILPPQRFGFVGAVQAPPPPGAPAAPVVAALPGAPNMTAVKVRPLAPENAVKKVQPIYPAAAKAAGAQGVVKVQVVANEAGEVVSASAVEGHTLLQPAAVEAVKQWRFKPLAMVNNRPVQVKSEVSFNFVLPPGTSAVTIAEEGNVLGVPSSEPVNESLGKQTIEGVEAEGTRSTFTIPENAIGNELPIKIINERWYSPELQTVVMTKRSDPRFGETVYRLTNINRSEPSQSLFEVPADYTLKEGPTGFRTMKKIRE